MKTIIVALFALMVSGIACGQDFSSKSIFNIEFLKDTIQIERSEDDFYVTIPFTTKIVDAKEWKDYKLKIELDKVNTELSPSKYEILNSEFDFKSLPNNQIFNVLIKKDMTENMKRYLFLDIKTYHDTLDVNKRNNGKYKKITLVINPLKQTVRQTLEEYYAKKLFWVTEVKSKEDILLVSGYEDAEKTTTKTTKEIKMTKGQVFTINQWGLELAPTLISIPYKVRPSMGNFPMETQSGLNSLGVNFAIYGYTRDRYFANNTMSKHKFNIGLWSGPSIEELNSILTDGHLSVDKKTKQLFMSSAVTLTYSYNNITFSFIPVGYDFATSNIGKHFVYKEKRWFGFGIGIDPKLFNFISTKSD